MTVAVNTHDFQSNRQELNSVFPVYNKQYVGHDSTPPETHWFALRDIETRDMETYKEYLDSVFGTVGVTDENTYVIYENGIDQDMIPKDLYKEKCKRDYDVPTDHCDEPFPVHIPSIDLYHRRTVYGSVNIRYEAKDLISFDPPVSANEMTLKNCSGYSNVYGTAEFCITTAGTGIVYMFGIETYGSYSSLIPDFALKLGGDQCIKTTVHYFNAEISFYERGFNIPSFSVKDCVFHNYRTEIGANGTIQRVSSGGSGSCGFWCRVGEAFTGWNGFGSFFNFLNFKYIFIIILVLVLIFLFFMILKCYFSRRMSVVTKLHRS